MPHPKFTYQEVGTRGDALYQTLRPLVETPENIGKLLSLDIETGDYEIGSDENFDAQRKLQAKHPGAAIFTVRVGYNAVYALGGGIYRVPAVL